VVVNFWASYCVPCRDEFPLFKGELARHPDLVVIGVVYKDSPDLARAFYARFGATWPTIQDPQGRLAAAYRVVAPPQSYFVDRAGIVRSRQIGQVVEADFDRQFAAISG
jgi:cytochrome c biogenesis protein CcmG, thiol:disulfide interchange protein DsbE